MMIPTMKNKGKGWRQLLIAAIIIATIAALWVTLWPNQPGRQVKTMSFSASIMSTQVEFTLNFPASEEDNAIRAAEAAFGEMKRIEKIFNVYDRTSEVSILNNIAFKAPVLCSKTMYELLTVARNAAILSNGLFDITSGPLMKLWGFYRRKNELPEPKLTAEALQQVGFQKLRMNDQAQTVQFLHDGMLLDFGGVAKGYAVDRAAKVLAAHNFNDGVINLGGNLLLLPESQPVTVNIRNPFGGNNYSGSFVIYGKQAVATSGSYERFVEIDQRRYSHIMNPVTGQPVAGGLSSVTVIAESATMADVLSTAIFVAGGTAGGIKELEESGAIKVFTVAKP